jgi:DNA-binding transcriptional MerR regulator
MSGHDDNLTVGGTSSLVGVSVKALHHWDAIGLVRPSRRTWAGYRVYSSEDIARIHRVLVYKELGFSLADIGRILDDPAVDAREHLRRQRAQLVERVTHLEKMVGAVDRMLEASRTGMRLSPREQVDIFGDDWNPAWVDEAGEKWGDTPQWVQYVERASDLSPADWKEVAAETHQLDADLAAALRDGVEPGSEAANALAERHRALMSRYFDCTHSMHACMGRMFAGDPGFAAHFNSMAAGLAPWVRAAIFANARAHGVDPETATWELTQAVLPVQLDDLDALCESAVPPRRHARGGERLDHLAAHRQARRLAVGVGTVGEVEAAVDGVLGVLLVEEHVAAVALDGLAADLGGAAAHAAGEVGLGGDPVVAQLVEDLVDAIGVGDLGPGALFGDPLQPQRLQDRLGLRPDDRVVGLRAVHDGLEDVVVGAVAVVDEAAGGLAGVVGGLVVHGGNQLVRVLKGLCPVGATLPVGLLGGPGQDQRRDRGGIGHGRLVHLGAVAVLHVEGAIAVSICLDEAAG